MNTQLRSGRVLAIALFALTVGACDYISPVDANPNTVPSPTVDQLFTGIQVNTFFTSSSGLSRIAAIWTQQMAGTDRQFVSFDDYTITESDFDDEWENAYTQGGLRDIRSAIEQAEAVGRAQYAGVLKIYEAYLVGTIASFYGAIPYRQAADPDNASPLLDPQSQVYADVQALLTEAISDLGGGGPGAGSVDLNFGGDAASWIAVARTLKARYHMHWAETDATRYASALSEAALGVTDNDGNWRAVFSAAATENNPWYQFERDRSGYVSAGDFLVPLMNTNADPRRDFYYSDSPPAARASSLSPTGYGAPGFNLPIVSCSENYFIIAEAELQDGTPDEAAAIAAAQSALTCQEDAWGLPTATLRDLSTEKANIAGLTVATGLLEEIMNQKYIAMFLSPESFNDYKRTCLPAITENPGGMPGRLFYSISERQTNQNVPDTGTGTNGKYNENDPSAC